MSQTAKLSLPETIRNVVREHAGQVGALMPVLHGVQDHLGHIPDEAIPLIARAMNLSRAEVHGVMKFYHDFRSTPRARYQVHICRAEACQAMGSVQLEKHARKRLKIDYGQSSTDGRFSLHAVYCLGNCACTPTIRINDDIYARVTPQRFDELIDGLQEGQA